MIKIRKGDTVVVLSGKDKGRQGQVLKVLASGHVIVENINKSKKHQKPNPQRNEQGGIQEREAPIQVSNVAIFNAATSKADRVGFKILEDGRKVRLYKSTGEVIDA